MSRQTRLPHYCAWCLVGLYVAAFPGPVPVHAHTAEMAPADAQSLAIVAAADEFLATLSSDQREAALFAFGDSKQRARWSNFPEGFFRRAGVKWGNINAEQQAAFMKLLGAILSPAGIKMIQEQMLSDDVLSRQNGPAFGRANYHLSFLGEPSATTPWMLQFGGHHLALNATVAGPHVTLSPTLTGGQPARFSAEGRDIDIVGAEVAAATALLESLSAAQKGKAVIGGETIGPLAGAGKDGTVLPPEGLPAAEMDDKQKGLLTATIEARLRILNEDDFKATMAPISTNLTNTYFAFSGKVTDPRSGYWRITGPTILLEFSPQTRDGDQANHLHNIYRDPTNEYGAAWIRP